MHDKNQNMKKIIYRLAFATLLGGFVTSCGDGKSEEPKKEQMAVKEISLQDFFKNSEKSSYQISPNGDYFAFMAPYESRMNVFVQKIGTEESTRLTYVTDRDIAGYMWANNDRILYLKDNGGDENFGIYGINIDGSNSQNLTAAEGVKTQLIDDLERLRFE